MDVLSLINDVADDVAVANTKNEESYMYAKRYEGIDIEKLRKLIGDTPVLPRRRRHTHSLNSGSRHRSVH